MAKLVIQSGFGGNTLPTFDVADEGQARKQYLSWLQSNKADPNANKASFNGAALNLTQQEQDILYKYNINALEEGDIATAQSLGFSNPETRLSSDIKKRQAIQSAIESGQNISTFSPAQKASLGLGPSPYAGNFTGVQGEPSLYSQLDPRYTPPQSFLPYTPPKTPEYIQTGLTDFGKEYATSYRGGPNILPVPTAQLNGTVYNVPTGKGTFYSGSISGAPTGVDLTPYLKNTGTAPVPATPTIASTTPIATNLFSDLPAFDVVQPQYPIPYNISALSFPLTQAESQEQDLNQRLQKLSLTLAGKETESLSAENQYGIPQIVQTQNDLTAQLNSLKIEQQSLQNQAQGIPFAQQEAATGRGVTAAGIAPLTAAEERKNTLQQIGITSQALTVAAQLSATQGQLANAQYLAERSIRERFAPYEAEYEALSRNLQLIKSSPLAKAQEQAKALQIQQILDAQKAQIDQQRDNLSMVQKIALEVAATGKAPATFLDFLSKQTDPIQAYQLAAPYLQKPEETKLQFVSGTANQRSGYFNPATGEFTPTGGGGGGGLSPISPTPVVDAEGQQLVFGTPEYIIERLKKTSGSKTKPVASEREQLGKFANVVALTDNLVNSLNKTVNDPVMGYLKSLNPYDFDARAVNAQVTALVPSVARALYGEVGVLTDTDIERYLRTLPNIQSTPEQNKFIAMMTLANAKRAYEQTLLNLASSNVNVSGFVDSYQSLSSRLSGLEKQLGVGTSQSVAPVAGTQVETSDLQFSPQPTKQSEGIVSKVVNWGKWLLGF